MGIAIDQCRELFKEWASEKHYLLEQEKSGLYKNAFTESAWQAWQAGIIAWGYWLDDDWLTEKKEKLNERVSEVKPRKRKVSPV